MPRAEPAEKCYHYPSLTTRNLSALVVASACGVLHASASAGATVLPVVPLCCTEAGHTQRIWGGEKNEGKGKIYSKEKEKKQWCTFRALKILHEKSRIFEMRRILFLQKKPPKKKNFPPATSGRRALRARLPDSHRAERRVNLRDNKKRKSNPFSCTIRSTNRTKPMRLPEAGADATAGYFKKNGKFLQLWSSCIFWLQNARVSKDIANSIFLRSKKININGAAGEKKLGYGVKMLPITPQNHSTNPFFE